MLRANRIRVLNFVRLLAVVGLPHAFCDLHVCEYCCER